MAKNRMTPGSSRYHLPGADRLGTLCEPLRLAQGKAPLRNLVNTTNAANCPECRAVADPPSARLRTAHDRAALEGKVPFVVGGNPTPGERKRQAEHDAAQAARLRDSVPTLAEVKAAMPMIDQATGEVMPAKLAGRGEQGWGDDADRDSDAAAELARLVKVMDAKVSAWLSDVDQGVEEAEDICRIWQAIRKITRENGGK